MSAGGNHLLGAKDPGYLYATLQQPPTPIRDSIRKDNIMNEKSQIRPTYIVGVDAHSKKLAISIWDGTDPWHPILHSEIKSCEINAMEKTFERHVPLDSIVIIEASTNSRMLKIRLDELGFRAEIVRSDILEKKEKKRKIRDIQDARNLALAYIKGNIQEFVWMSSEEYDQYKDIHFAYRDTVKELTRISNRIWSICSQKGYKLPIRAGATKAASIREMIKELNISGFAKTRLEMLIKDYEYLYDRREELNRMMAEIAISNDKMLGLMQLPGFYLHAAFVIQAIVEDPKRFSTASKLAAYSALSPILNTSGEEEERARIKGGTGKPLDTAGRHDLKFYCCEAGQTVLNLAGNTKLGKWGWSMINKGKPKNKVVCAIGRKLMTYAWHIMMGHSAPNRDGEAMFKRKMIRLFSEVGKTRMNELGYKSRAEFAEIMTEKFYGHLQIEIKSEMP